MNALEDQVISLTRLADSPVAPIPFFQMNGQQNSSSAASPAQDSGNSNGKRKADEESGSGGHTRAKRNRYISIACDQCKRRKIKCNGNTPCQRCGNLNLECKYAPNCCSNGFKDSEEFRQMNSQIASLQEQVDNLYANINAMRGDPNLAIADSLSYPRPSERSMSMSQHSGNHSGSVDSPGMSRPNRSTPKPPRFQGPTSSAFSLDVAKTTLHNMGLPPLEGGEDGPTRDDTPLGSPPPRVPLASIHPSKDPLWLFSKEEAIRLVKIYEEEMGIMYPIIDIEAIILHTTNLYTFLDAAQRTGLAQLSLPGDDGVRDENSCVLKMVLACALMVEGSGQSELGVRLFESVRGVADNFLYADTADLKNIPLLVLCAMYHFHCDEEALAWRLIGQVARMCIELGLHRRESLFKTLVNEEERTEATKLFWSVYVLDRRWSFGTGMPFALQDADIDPALPEPDPALEYLNVMISYSRIGSKVWRSITGFDATGVTDIKKEEIGFLDYQIVQWQKSIPQSLQLPTTNSPQTASRAIRRLQILLYLRANQMRILIYRPVLHSANSIMDNLPYAQSVVELAKDTIRALTHLNQTSDIYRVHQVCFNYFLISALAVVFLGSCHAPMQFSAGSREEFYMALDLVKGFSSKSWVSKRLWRTIRGLKEVGPKLGLSENTTTASPNSEDPHSSAALAMAGLAGHEFNGMGNFNMQGQGQSQGQHRQQGNSPMNGFQMSHEMTNLFEAALGSASAINGTSHGIVGTGLQDGVQIDGFGVGVVNGASNFGGEEELYRQMRELF